jgi:tetratricopeptide (TPR) repeat protein
MGIHFERGQVLFGLKRYREAIEAYQAELAENPDAADVYAMMAAALINLNEHQRAKLAIRRALAIAPDSAYAHYLLSFVEPNSYVNSPAQKAIEEAIRLEPTATHYFRLGAIHHQNDKNRKCLDAVHLALQINPAHIDALVLRAKTLVRLNRTEEAEETMREALRIAPQNAEVHLSLGKTILNEGDAPVAIPFLLEARRLSPSTHNDPFAIADAYGRDIRPFRRLNAIGKWYLDAGPMTHWAVASSIASATILFLAFIPRESFQEKDAAFLLLAFFFNMLFVLAFSSLYSGMIATVANKKELGLGWQDVVSAVAGTQFALMVLHALFAAMAYAFVKMPSFAFLALAVVLGSLHSIGADHRWNLREWIVYPPAIVALIALGGYGAYMFAEEEMTTSLISWFGIVAVTGICTRLTK